MFKNIKASLIIILFFLLLPASLLTPFYVSSFFPEETPHRDILNQWKAAPIVYQSLEEVKFKRSSVQLEGPANDSHLIENEWHPYVYQRLTSEGWEIVFRSREWDGSRYILKQLTSNNNADIQPKLNTLAQKIVFASDRDGDFEIYTMDTDGSNVQQLTFNSVDDSFPSWSFDNQRIAFQREVDGQSDVYVMNADGSSELNLTQGNPDFDGHPSWSPTDLKIAYSSRVNGLYRIWTMNPDGSNKSQQSHEPFSLFPVWSTVGDHIAYAADLNSDSFFETWILDLSNDSRSQLVGGGEIDYSRLEPRATDYIPTAWAEIENVFAYTSYSYQYDKQGKKWFLVDIDLGADALDPDIFIYGVMGNGVFPEANASWRSMDIEPPVASLVGEIPEYMHWNNATITYTMSDNLSGIEEGVLVHTRNGEFPNFESGPLVGEGENNTVDLPREVGQTVKFYITAQDYAENKMPRIHSPFGQTKIYSFSVLGNVESNRGEPLTGHPLNFAPSVFENEVVTDAAGDFLVHGKEDFHSIEIVDSEDNAYGSIGVSRFRYESELNIPITTYIVPADNVIINGDFEDHELGNGSIEGWRRVGSGAAAVNEFLPVPNGNFFVSLHSGGAIEQSVVIPTNIISPTLALLVSGSKLNGGSGELSDAYFTVEVSDGETVEKFDRSRNGGWDVDWFDLSAWTGKTISLTIKSRDDLNSGGFVTLDIDQISLGSYLPDIYAAINGPNNIRGTDSFQIELEYGNGSADKVTDVTLQAELNPQFEIVSSSIPYSKTENTLVWVFPSLSGNNDQLITLQLAVRDNYKSIPPSMNRVEITSAKQSLPYGNNSDSLTILIQEYAFLPTLIKQ